MAGLKVSDHPFGFVLFTQRDTITKGLKLPVTFRVNPSGIPFAQDMVALDNMADTPYLLVEESTKASYVTPSKNFQIDSLGKTRNAAKEETDGQYFVRLKTTETRNMIHDNTFALIGAYKDKEGKEQLVSTQPFNIVMMPTPEEGLTKWHYSHGNVTYIEDKTTETKDPVTGESKNISTKEEKLGVITVSFDPRTYEDPVGKGRQYYTTKKYIYQMSFEGDSKADSIVLFMPNRDSGFVRFMPDTTKASTLTVKGKIHAYDRYGGSSSFPVEMTWHSRYTDTLTVNYKLSDFYENGTRKSVEFSLADEFKKLGYDTDEAASLPRIFMDKFYRTTHGSRVMFSLTGDNGTTCRMSYYGSHETLPGTYRAVVGCFLRVAPLPSPTYSVQQIYIPINVILTITQ